MLRRKRGIEGARKKPIGIRLLAILFGIIFALNIVSIALMLVLKLPHFLFLQELGVVDVYLPLIEAAAMAAISLIAMIGLWKYAKFGMYSAGALCAYGIIRGAGQVNILKIIFHAAILYYLYEKRGAF